MRSTKLLSARSLNEAQRQISEENEDEHVTLEQDEEEEWRDDEDEERPPPNYEDGFSFINYGTSVDKWLSAEQPPMFGMKFIF